MKKRVRHSRFDHLIYILTSVVFVIILVVNNVDIPGSSAAVSFNPNATYDTNGDISQTKATIGTVTGNSGSAVFTVNPSSASRSAMLDDMNIGIFKAAGGYDKFVANNIKRMEEEEVYWQNITKKIESETAHVQDRMQSDASRKFRKAMDNWFAPWLNKGRQVIDTIGNASANVWKMIVAIGKNKWSGPIQPPSAKTQEDNFNNPSVNQLPKPISPAPSTPPDRKINPPVTRDDTGDDLITPPQGL